MYQEGNPFAFVETRIHDQHTQGNRLFLLFCSKMAPKASLLKSMEIFAGRDSKVVVRVHFKQVLQIINSFLLRLIKWLFNVILELCAKRSNDLWVVENEAIWVIAHVEIALQLFFLIRVGHLKIASILEVSCLSLSIYKSFWFMP